MVKLLGEVKVERFIDQIVQQLPYEIDDKEQFMYKFHHNEAICFIGYEKKKTLLSKAYHFTVKIQKEIQGEGSFQEEVQYQFHKQKWISKKGDQLLKLANQCFQLNWTDLDMVKLNIVEEKGTRTLTMSLLPGSYNVLLFPPLTQGIEIYPKEMKTLVQLIDLISARLDKSLAVE